MQWIPVRVDCTWQLADVLWSSGNSMVFPGYQHELVSASQSNLQSVNIDINCKQNAWSNRIQQQNYWILNIIQSNFDDIWRSLISDITLIKIPTRFQISKMWKFVVQNVLKIGLFEKIKIEKVMYQASITTLEGLIENCNMW